MTGRHAKERRGHAAYLASLAVIGLAAALLMYSLTGTAATRRAARELPTAGTTAGTTVQSTIAPATIRAVPPVHSTAPRAIPKLSPSATAAAAALTTLIADADADDISVTAYNTVTGRTVTMGATSGMVTASVVKLQLLETLLLEHDRSHTTLSDYEDTGATSMIEHSDNGAAEAVFEACGERPGVVSHEEALGLSRKTTVPGSTDYWGLTTTSAAQQVILLRNLVEPSSPLARTSREYALTLMQNVEADQRWGVPAVADVHTTYAVKNGWLGIDDDDGLWAVNSDGIVTANGQKLLMSVMTQHNANESVGIALIEKVARAAASAVAG